MAEESGEAKVGAHGILMIVAFLFIAQAAETIAIYASSKVRRWDWGSWCAAVRMSDLSDAPHPLPPHAHGWARRTCERTTSR